MVSASEDGTLIFSFIKEIVDGFDLNSNKTILENSKDLLKRKHLYQAHKCKIHLNMNGLLLAKYGVMDRKESLFQELKYQTNDYNGEELKEISNRYTEEIMQLNAANSKELDQGKFTKLEEEHNAEVRVL